MSVYSLHISGLKHITDSVYCNHQPQESSKSIKGHHKINSSQLLNQKVLVNNNALIGNQSQHKTSLKKTIYSYIDTISDPKRNIHSSRGPQNYETMMHRNDFHLKKYQPRGESIEKEWKSSIRTYHTEITQKSVSPPTNQKPKICQQSRNPILSPSSGKKYRPTKKTQFDKVPKKQNKNGIKIFKQANSSQGFVNTLDQNSPRNKPITIISPRFGEGVQMKQIFSEFFVNQQTKK
ncbi:unnamed protein product (macronuclear) [Paramecium tetraurelia]|uniref:Uncharacterized protein n=1 Tax=Paramecium tetraurelia TaxID=5888 RepID=A0BH11_PARTE|nr:uncharacterized protein GSPATT00028863001 [Paramecium tetraurelia]CAK57828.1 unnamed protein product [Paramecium tetraurelia]|eukprot:XP_001425226.1 hypothetical protein (macronuclear) [Paramecium tetraurelia strain d4-2]